MLQGYGTGQLKREQEPEFIKTLTWCWWAQSCSGYRDREGGVVGEGIRKEDRGRRVPEPENTILRVISLRA